MKPEITITEFLETARRAGLVVDHAADFNRGSDYEALSGPNAILWSRQSQRDTDLWRAVRFGDATGQDLTEMGAARYNIERVLDTRGTGSIALIRPSTAAGPGTVWAGTRFRISTGAFTEAIYYRAVEDVPAAGLTVTVPIEALEYGPGSRAYTASALHIVDLLWDSSWAPLHLQCSDGTRLEAANDYRQRIRDTRAGGRVGQEDAIIAACKAQGAGQVALFRSDYAGLGLDWGLNYAYVGDLGFVGSTELVRACTAALRSVRVGGDNLQVLPLGVANVAVQANVYLIENPVDLPVARLEEIHRRALIQYFAGDEGAFSYSRNGIESAISRSTVEVQDVDIITPSVDTDVQTNGSFPPVLRRYYLNDTDIALKYFGPA